MLSILSVEVGDIAKKKHFNMVTTKNPSQELSLNWKGLNALASSHPDPRYLCSSPNKIFQNQNQTPIPGSPRCWGTDTATRPSCGKSCNMYCNHVMSHLPWCHLLHLSSSIIKRLNRPPCDSQSNFITNTYQIAPGTCTTSRRRWRRSCEALVWSFLC